MLKNGLTLPSVALGFQLTPVDKRNFLYQLGVLDKHTLDQVLALINQLTA
jgi:hypothetical protein